MTSTGVVSKKWEKQVTAYLNSLPVDQKATQEGCISDTGISPGFIESLKSQGRKGHADNYLKAMQWHLRDKHAKSTKTKRTYYRKHKGWSTTPERQAAKLKRTTDTMERIPLQLEEQSAQDGVLESTINPNAAADVQNSASQSTSPAPASSVPHPLCTKHHWDESHLWRPRQWKAVREFMRRGARPWRGNKNIRLRHWSPAAGGGFTLEVRGSLKRTITGIRNKQLQVKLACDVLAALEEEFPEAAVRRKKQRQDPSRKLTPAEAATKEKERLRK